MSFGWLLLDQAKRRRKLRMLTVPFLDERNLKSRSSKGNLRLAFDYDKTSSNKASPQPRLTVLAFLPACRQAGKPGLRCPNRSFFFETAMKRRPQTVIAIAGGASRVDSTCGFHEDIQLSVRVLMMQESAYREQVHHTSTIRLRRSLV